MEKKIKHLEMILGIVNRMGSNSFFLKGWSVTIVAGLLALSIATQEKIVLCSLLLSLSLYSGYWTGTFYRKSGYLEHSTSMSPKKMNLR